MLQKVPPTCPASLQLMFADLNHSPKDHRHTEKQKQLITEEQPCSSAFDFYSSRMERGLILLVAALVVYVVPDVQGTSHLSFSNNTEVDITRDGCGTTKLCVESPDDCDPTNNRMCQFASVTAGTPMPPNGTTLSIELAGYSMGYIAMGLTMNSTMGSTMLFLCVQNTSNNGSFFFRTRDKNNMNQTLTPNERNVREIRGMVDGNVIKCEFDIPYVNTTDTTVTTRTAGTDFQIILGNGTYNSTGLGPFNTILTTARLNLSDPTSNIAAATTTAAPTATPHDSSAAVMPHAVLILLSVISLVFMLGA